MKEEVEHISHLNKEKEYFLSDQVGLIKELNECLEMKNIIGIFCHKENQNFYKVRYIISVTFMFIFLILYLEVSLV